MTTVSNSPFSAEATKILIDIHTKVGNIEASITRIPHLEADVKELSKKVQRLEGWRNVMLGVAFAVGFFFPTLGAKISTWVSTIPG